MDGQVIFDHFDFSGTKEYHISEFYSCRLLYFFVTENEHPVGDSQKMVEYGAVMICKICAYFNMTNCQLFHVIRSILTILHPEYTKMCFVIVHMYKHDFIYTTLFIIHLLHVSYRTLQYFLLLLSYKLFFLYFPRTVFNLLHQNETLLLWIHTAVWFRSLQYDWSVSIIVIVLSLYNWIY
jgi:hypothetical protein